MYFHCCRLPCTINYTFIHHLTNITSSQRMIETLDASSKALLDTVKLWTTTISIVLSVLAIYVLVRFLNQSTTLYRNLLVAITVRMVE